MLDVAQISQWLGKLKQGALTAADLEQALEQLKQGRVSSTSQRLLYRQTHTTDRLDYLQVFYYPQSATRKMDPTEIRSSITPVC